MLAQYDAHLLQALSAIAVQINPRYKTNSFSIITLILLLKTFQVYVLLLKMNTHYKGLNSCRWGDKNMYFAIKM